MIVLVLAAILVIAIVVWVLARPLKQAVSMGDEAQARLDQYVQARERLLMQLDTVEEQKSEGTMDAQIADDEISRLEVELASVLKHIESCEQENKNQNMDGGEQRLRWLLALVSFALILPVLSLVVYVTHQSDTLLTIASDSSPQSMPLNHPAAPAAQASSAQQFPPEVMQMVQRLEERLQANPDDGEGWKRLGRSYRVMGRINESRVAYQRAAELLPNDDDVKSALASLADAQTPGSSGSPADATPEFPPQVLAMVKQLEDKLKNNPDDGEGWKRLGRAYTVMKRYNEAVSAYTSAAEILPQDKDIQRALQQLAQIAAQKGNHPDEAEQDNSGNKAAHGNIPKDMLQRLLALEQQAASTPKDATVWAKLGGAYMEMGRNDDGIRAFKQATSLAPQDIDILAAYAEAVFTSDPRDPDGSALELYQKLNTLDPNHPDGLWFLGLAAYSEGNAGRALDYWTRLVQVLPPDSEASRSVRSAIERLKSLLNQKK